MRIVIIHSSIQLSVYADDIMIVVGSRSVLDNAFFSLESWADQARLDFGKSELIYKQARLHSQ